MIATEPKFLEVLIKTKVKVVVGRYCYYDYLKIAYERLLNNWPVTSGLVAIKSNHNSSTKLLSIAWFSSKEENWSDYERS